MSKKIFSKLNWQEQLPREREYEHCLFQNCDFSKVDLSAFKFIDCDFVDCNLAMARTVKTSFQEVNFITCKLTGFRLDQCNPFLLSASFDHSILEHAVFAGVKLNKTIFRNCRLQGSDFTGAELKQVHFLESDLSDVQFERCILEKCDFRTAIHYRIDPDSARIKKSMFSVTGLPGLLSKYDLVIEE